MTTREFYALLTLGSARVGTWQYCTWRVYNIIEQAVAKLHQVHLSLAFVYVKLHPLKPLQGTLNKRQETCWG